MTRHLRRYLPFGVVALALSLVIALAPSTAGRGAPSSVAVPKVSGSGGSPCARAIDVTDLQACAPQWSGGSNGGATWSGVTKDSINIVAYNAPDNALIAQLLGGTGPGKLIGTPEEEAHTLRVYEQWFNQHFQTYGRRVHVVSYSSAGTLSNSSTASRSDAVAIEKQDHAFLTIGGELDESFFTQLARERIISMAGSQMPETFLEANAPYIYGLMPSTDDQNSFIAAFVCHQLGPQSVAFFGGENSNPPVYNQPRRYGIIYPTSNADGSPSMLSSTAGDLSAKLARCGIHVPHQDQVGYSLDPTTALSQVQSGDTRLRQDGVTTLICLCDPISPTFSAGQADQQNYFPEEVETGYLLQDYYQLDQLYNQTEWSHVFGISSLPVSNTPPDQQLYYQAYRSIDPNSVPNVDAQIEFYELLLAFAGIEGAGPDLNPTTFARAMFTRVKINSTSPGLPTFYYTPTDYGGIKDAQIVWWDPSAPSPDGKPGNFQSVDGGYRFTTADWPTVPGTTLWHNTACLPMGSCGLPSYSPGSS